MKSVPEKIYGALWPDLYMGLRFGMSIRYSCIFLCVLHFHFHFLLPTRLSCSTLFPNKHTFHGKNIFFGFLVQSRIYTMVLSYFCYSNYSLQNTKSLLLADIQSVEERQHGDWTAFSPQSMHWHATPLYYFGLSRSIGNFVAWKERLRSMINTKAGFSFIKSFHLVGIRNHKIMKMKYFHTNNKNKSLWF